MLDRVRTEITQMTRDHAPRGHLRPFLYQARILVSEAITKAGAQRQRAVHAASHAAELVWRERALNAEDALKIAHDEIRTQRDRIAELLDRIRDLEPTSPRHLRPVPQSPTMTD